MATDFVNELNSLDFSKYIGGPMQAAVDAQNSAALSQVNFIQEVGLNIERNNNGEITSQSLRMIDFSYTKTNSDGTTDEVSLKVPFLTMLSIPALRISEMTIDFNCKLNSVETHDESKSLGIAASVGANAWKIKFNVSAAYQQQSSDTEKVQRTYSMKIHVKIENDEMPTGLERLLDILESMIEAQLNPPQSSGTDIDEEGDETNNLGN